MSKFRLILDEAPEEREVLRQALADAVYYRDPPVWCPACRVPDRLCEECAAGLARARAYLALSRALGLETVP
jgi:hypothetical protein